MNYIKDFIGFLSGKKAYICGILMVILGLLNGDQRLILEGFSVIFIRAGIAKVDRVS